MSNDLPSDIDSLKKVIFDLNNKIEQKDKEILELREQVAFFKGLKFAPKSEKVPAEQLGIFNEIEFEGHLGDAEDDSAPEGPAEDLIQVPAHEKRRGKRRPLPESLPREVVIIDVSDKKCKSDGHELKVIGEEVSEQLEIIPGRLRVIRTVRKKYSCPYCEKVETAPAPSVLLPKSYATPSLIAFVVASKYIDGIPLYRMESVMERFGIDIPRQTMARWMIEVGEKLMPLKTILREELLSSNYLHYDETPIQVLKEKDRSATAKSYMWVAAREGPKPIILFDYDPSRSGKVACSLLEGFKGYLQVDGFEGYNEFCRSSGIVRVGCWAHVRRYFKNAFDHSSSKKEGAQGLAIIKKLYEIEEKIKDLPWHQKESVRQEKAVKVMEDFKKWMEEKILKVLPKGLAGKAINYALNEWDTLQIYLTRGELSIDNNYVERAIRPFAIGRKNWLFADTPQGAHASALFYSLIETAKANGKEPFEYLSRVLEKIPTAQKAEDYYGLLPFVLED